MNTTLQEMVDNQIAACAAQVRLGTPTVHARTVRWRTRDGATCKVWAGWYATQEEADERALSDACACGWEPAKWWQWWRWGEQG